MFGKLLRKPERAYWRSQALDIEEMKTNNPTELWRKIKQLEPRNDKAILIEIIDNQERIVRDEHFVFEKWKTEFKNV